MKQASAIGDTDTIFQLIHTTEPKQAGVSETVCEKSGKMKKIRRMAYWKVVVHFKGQFHWAALTRDVSTEAPIADACAVLPRVVEQPR